MPSLAELKGPLSNGKLWTERRSVEKESDNLFMTKTPMSFANAQPASERRSTGASVGEEGQPTENRSQ